MFKIDQQAALADYMVVASGQSGKQITRMAEKLIERLKARGHDYIQTEGMSQGDWVIVDAGEIIIHLFRPEVRSFYNLEKIWSPHTSMDVIEGTSSGNTAGAY